MGDYISEPCPVCSSNDSAEIVFGFPGDIRAIQSELDAGTKVLGGCDIPEDPPRYQCKICNHEWGESEWKAILEAANETREHRERELEEAAELRGVLEVTPNANGYARCPYCGVSFSTRYPMSWDGQMHKTCRTRLKISNV